MWWTILLYGLGGALVAAGLIGLALPVVPGAVLMFAGVLSLAWAGDFARIGTMQLVVTGLLAAAIVLVDYVAQVAGASRFGASWWGLAGAMLGLLGGLPFGLVGIVAGPVVGAVLLEYLTEPDLRRAGRVGLGTLLGFVAGTAVKYAIALIMLGLIVFWLWP